MATPSYARSLVGACKRLKLSPSTPTIQHQLRQIQSTSNNAATATQMSESSTDLAAQLSALRLPKAVQATYLNPLRRQPSHGIPSADLQLRSYSVRNLELFADFAMRAAYFLNLAAKGPVPLPRFTERWTVPRSNFVHKKSQENFERRTMRRMIRIVDGEPQTVAIWLAYLKKHQYYGVGMKADVWESGALDVGAELDAEAERIEKMMGQDDAVVELFEDNGMFGGRTRGQRADKILHAEPFKTQWGAGGAMGGSPSVKDSNAKIAAVHVGEKPKKNKQKESEDS